MNQTDDPKGDLLDETRVFWQARSSSKLSREDAKAIIGGKPCVIEYEPDGDLRDTEQIPLLEEGGIEAFLHREVLPHASDAWYDPASVKTGYEISFTRYFYKPQPLRSLEEIRADILALEKETEGLLEEILKGGQE